MTRGKGKSDNEQDEKRKKVDEEFMMNSLIFELKTIALKRFISTSLSGEKMCLLQRINTNLLH